jgi:hypothetical protein
MKRSSAISFTTKTAEKFRRQIVVGWIFAALWLVFVGAFDVYFAWSAARQLNAANTWKQVTGTITESEVITGKTRKGKSTYRPSISYTYTVGSTQYTGNTINAFGVNSTGRSYSSDVVGAYPKGATVPIFVDPSDPTRAALRVGLQPATIRMLLFSLPFNAVLLGLIPFLIRARKIASDPMQGWVVVDEPDRTVLRVIHWEPWTAGCLAMGVASFVGIFAIMVPNRGEPPPEQVFAAIAGSVLVGLALYAWRRAAISAGKFDVEIDRRLKRIMFPRTAGNLERASFRCEQLEAKIEPDAKRQINRQPSWQLHLSQTGTSHTFTVYWLERPTAKLLGRWIASECHIRLKTRQTALEAD